MQCTPHSSLLGETATASNFLAVLGQRCAGLGKLLVFRETVKWGRFSSFLIRVGQHVRLYCVLPWMVKLVMSYMLMHVEYKTCTAKVDTLATLQ